MLRGYQQRGIDTLYKWLRENIGHPCIVFPTGAGKSHIVAALCKDAIQNWPETRVLMLTHSKELIEQNAQKMREHWKGAPMGIYSASIGKKQLGEPITFAGIQSLRGKAKLIGHIDLVIIDECHLVSHKDEGGYRQLISELTAINPVIRVVGLTATPYRLGHGLITDKPAIFDSLIEPVTIEELIYKGYLAPLRSKVTRAKLDTTGVKKRGGEYIESELQAAVDNDDVNARVVSEVIELAEGRQSWLFFCTGVQHAQHIADELKLRGINAACVTGETNKKEREKIIAGFVSGEIKALTNANVLTTGFDAPNTDLIVMLRPTLSPSLYVQMAGRGARLKKHTDHCLVLDFAGVVETHGPITNVQPPKKGGKGDGDAPAKACPECAEICHLSAKECTACGFVFPPPPPKELRLRDDDIMGIAGREMIVSSWVWKEHTSKASGKKMLMVKYYGGLADAPVAEYFPVLHDGAAGFAAREKMYMMARQSGADVSRLMAMDETLKDFVQAFNFSKAPSVVEYKKDGKFFNVTKRVW